MDEVLSKAVEEVFIRMYEKGAIYRGDRMINWCPTCKSSLSDIEVEPQEESSHLWYIRYYTKDKKEYVTVATTRPETMLGDTGVAVSPDDERYKDMIRKNISSTFCKPLNTINWRFVCIKRIWYRCCLVNSCT